MEKLSGRRQFGRRKDFLFGVQNTSNSKKAGYMDLNGIQLLVLPMFENYNENKSSFGNVTVKTYVVLSEGGSSSWICFRMGIVSKPGLMKSKSFCELFGNSVAQLITVSRFCASSWFVCKISIS